MMRAASPPTHHLLPLPAPPAPLPLPSSVRIADISEADMPPQKRLMLTAPTPRGETRESSATAAARQPGSTVARRVDYSFMDTVDASIEEREACLRERESSKTRQALARSEAHNRALEAQIATMETQLYHMEWQRQDANDRTIIHIMRTQALEAGARKMPPKRTAATTTPMTDAHIKALIAQDIAGALAKCDADRSRNGDDSHDSRSGRRRQMPNTRETVGHDVAYVMPWKTLKNMMTDKYCPKGEIKKLETEMRIFPEVFDEVEKYVSSLPDMIHGSVMTSKPKTMQDAIEFATELMDQKIRTLAERQAENKRKSDDTLRNNQNQHQPFKRHNVAHTYTIGSGEKKPYGGSKPLCFKCNYHHDG
ncbi:hypothetical protein Tco_0521116 [Tanacetum coccineum]